MHSLHERLPRCAARTTESKRGKEINEGRG